jgi:hypothetical protein
MAKFLTSADQNAPADNTTRGGFKKSDRLININIPYVDDNGQERYFQLALGGLHVEKADQADLISWLDDDPTRLKDLLIAAAEVSTYVNPGKPKGKTFAFMG